MNNLNQLFDLLAKALLGAHPKSSWGGYAIAGLLIAWQVWVAYNGGTADPIIISAAIGIAFGGRVMNPTKPGEPPSSPGTGTPGAMAILLLGMMLLIPAAGMLTGCSSASQAMDSAGSGSGSAFMQAQGAIDAASPSWFGRVLGWFRSEEGKAYAARNGLISTNGSEVVVDLYDEEAGRWIDGEVTPYQTITRKLAPIGVKPSKRPPAYRPLTPTPAAPTQATPASTTNLLQSLQQLAAQSNATTAPITPAP